MEYRIQKETLENIAEAIRYKLDTDEGIEPENMDDAIRNIPSGGSNVTMEDNPEGGVDLTVDDETRTFAKESDLAETNAALLQLNEKKADKASLAETNRSLDLFWKLNKGQIYDFETVEAESYSNTIPSGSKLANVQMIGGKSIVLNQLVRNGNFADKSVWQGLTLDAIVSNNELSFSVENSSIFIYQVIDVPINHVVYVSTTVKADTPLRAYQSFGSSEMLNVFDVTSQYTRASKVYTHTSTSNNYNAFRVAEKVTRTVSIKNAMVVDLTQMFGAGNEPTVEQFEAMFTEDYYQYNKGELISASSKSVEVKNAQGEVVTELTTDFGVLRSAGSVYDYIDFERSVIVRRVGVVDLGSLNWAFAGTSAVTFYCTDTMFFEGQKLLTVPYANKYDSDGDNWVFCLRLILRLKDTSKATMTATEFKSAMQGVMLYYELKTPIEEPISIADGFKTIDVEVNGTITFKNNTDYALPVPNKTEYLLRLDEVN